MIARRLALAFTLSLVLPVALAGAQDGRERASVHFERGIALFNEGNLDASLAELQRAYELAPAFPVLYNLARVHAQLGHPVDAARAYERYLLEGAARIPAARRTEVEAEIARQRDRIGTLDVVTNVPGSTISVDGVDVASTPLESGIELGAGAHTVGVRAPGYEIVNRAIQIAGRTETRISVELRREIEERGILRITASLPDVVIRIDGAEIGRTPLGETIPVAAGDHDISASRAGYLNETRRVHVEDQAEVDVRFRMEPDADPDAEHVGALAVPLPPDAPATMRIDGEERSVASRLQLPIGTHHIEISVTDRQPWTGEVHITPGEPLNLTLTLAWTPEARHSRLAAAESQRTAGIATTITGAVVLAVGLPLVIWNESEIASTDSRVVAVDAMIQMARCNEAPGSGPCPELLSERDELIENQGQQDVLRGVSVATTALGALLTGIGVSVWTSAPSTEEVDRAAQATLIVAPDGLRLSGTF